MEYRKKPEPLRHGWGGNMKARDAFLREKREEILEKFQFLNKFGDEPYTPTKQEYQLFNSTKKTFLAFSSLLRFNTILQYNHLIHEIIKNLGPHHL